MGYTARDDTIGVIGLGDMGGGIAHTLVRTGFDVLVFDLDETRVEEVVRTGAKAASSAEALAQRAGIVSVIVFDDDQVRDVARLVLEHARPGTRIVIHSTVRVSTVIGLAEQARRREMTLLDCGVNGGRDGALRGRLTLMIGGEEEAVHHCWPLFEAIGEKLFHVGPVGAGVTAKLVNNMLLVGIYALNLEAMEFAAAYGLDEDTVTRVVTAAQGDSRGMRTWPRHDRSRRDRQADENADLSERMSKDVFEAMIAAGERGVILPIASVVAEALPYKLRQRDRRLDLSYGKNVSPHLPRCNVCGYELAVPYRAAGVHPECRFIYDM